MQARFLFVPALTAALALSACAGPGAQAKPTVAAAGAPAGGAAAPAKPPGPYVPNGEADATSGTASLQLLDAMKFQPNSLKAKPGQQVKVDLKNAGGTIHSFIAPTLGVATKVTVNGGQSGSVTFTAPSQPGTYFFWCPEPGHAEAGMTGQVVVQ